MRGQKAQEVALRGPLTRPILGEGKRRQTRGHGLFPGSAEGFMPWAVLNRGQLIATVHLIVTALRKWKPKHINNRNHLDSTIEPLHATLLWI
jgi:hypothetical protein